MEILEEDRFKEDMDIEEFWNSSIVFCNLLWTSKHYLYEAEDIKEQLRAIHAGFGC